jgi:uncharacterized membrane protein
MPSNLLTQLKRAVKGLLYPSESDEPFDVVHWSGGSRLTEKELLSRGNHPADADVEQFSFDEFFADLTAEQDGADEEDRKTAERFRRLKELLGEHLSGLRLLAIGLAVAGILSLADLGRLREGRVGAGSLATLLLAMVLFGVSATIYKAAMGAGVGPGTFLVVQGSTFLALGLVLSALTDRLRINRATWVHAPFCGVLLSSALFLLLASLRLGDATVSVPISQLSFVLTSLLAVAFLRERLSRGRVLGTAAAVLAVVTFNLPGQ